MKYKIIMEKNLNSGYSAYSPVMGNLKVEGVSIAVVLENLRNKMLCYLHDPQIELDIILESSDSGMLDGLTGHRTPYIGKEK